MFIPDAGQILAVTLGVTLAIAQLQLDESPDDTDGGDGDDGDDDGDLVPVEAA